MALADFLGWVLSGVPAINRELWRRTGADFQNLWHKALNALQCDDLHYQPAGLRGGGATEHFLRHPDVQGLRRRGRWTQLTTLDRCLQEGAATCAAHRGSQATPAPGSPGDRLLSASARPASTPSRHLQQDMVESVALRSIDRIAARWRGSAYVYWPSSRARKQGLSSLCLSPYIYIYNERIGQ